MTRTLFELATVFSLADHVYAVCREELEPRPSREPPEPSSRNTTESKSLPTGRAAYGRVFFGLLIGRVCRLTKDFHTNKRILDDVSVIQTKRLRNKIAGYTTHLMKRIEKGPVRGISLRLQEEERERKMDFIPDKSEIQVDKIEPGKDQVLKQLIKDLGVKKLIPAMNRKQQKQ